MKAAAFALCMLSVANAQVGPCPDTDPDCKKFSAPPPVPCPQSDPACKKFTEAAAVATEVVELIDGFILGALETEQVYSLDSCVADFNPLVTDMVNAVNDFEDGSYHKIADGVY